MIKRLAIFGLPMALAIFLGACGPSMNPGTGGGSDPTPSVTAIHVASSGAVGTYLTMTTGLTLYYFTPERDSHAAAPHIVCTGSCATTWPPLLAPSGQLTTDVTLPGTLKTIVRPDGGRQVTYNDWPLYTFSGDTNPGDTNGQGVGGQWFVAGINLTEDLATPTPSAAPTAPPSTAAPVPTAPPPTVMPRPTSCIPGANGGDHDADNNGGPNDGDGCQ